MQALLGDDPSLEPLTPLLIARTGGNPFFLEESVRTLVETGVLVGEHGAYRRAQAIPTIQVPATVQAMLAARIDRLPPEEKGLLQRAAVIGHEVPLPLLQAIADLPEEVLHRSLAHLQATELLYETRLFPEPEYTFKHALTHEVAYNSLLLERRRGLQRAWSWSWRRWRPTGRPSAGGQVERLAYHALRGEVWDKAVAYCQQAGARAYDRAAFREGLAAFEQALQALAHLPEHGDTRGLAIDLRLALGGPLYALGEFGRWLALLGEVEALARALDDRARLGRVLAEMAHTRRTTGDLGGAIAAGRQAFELAAALGDSTVQVRVSYPWGWHTKPSATSAGRPRCCGGMWRRQTGGLTRPVRPYGSSPCIARGTLGVLGAFAESRRHGEEALRVATLEGRGATPVIAHAYLQATCTSPGGPGARHPDVRPGPGPCGVPPATAMCCNDRGRPGRCLCAPGAPGGRAGAAG